MSNNKDFKVKNGIQPTVYHEGLGTVTSGSVTVGYEDVSTWAYDSVSFDTASQGGPFGIVFKSDGTKMYVLSGFTPDSIYQYSLSTAWDVSTASYDSVSLNVSGQDADMYGLTVSSDGAYFYVIGDAGNSVYQYDLSSSWDLSTASYNQSFSVGSQETAPRVIEFNSSGTKMYVVGNTNNTVYQYTLSTAYDISSASYDSVSFSVSSEGHTSPSGLRFNNDGTKMYVVSSSADKVSEYELSSAYDLSTASYSSSDFSLSGQDTNPYDIFFKPDGTKMYMAGATNTDIFQYTTGSTVTTNTLDLSTGSVFEITPTADIQIGLSNPAASGTVSQATLLLDGAVNGYDISGAAYDSVSFVTSELSNAATGIYIGDSGTKMYLSQNNLNGVYQYSLSTAWDLSTASYASKSLSVASQASNTQDVALSSDGTKLYVGCSDTNAIYQYTLSTAWDLSTGSYASKSININAQETVIRGIHFKPDGLKLYITGGTDAVYEYDLSTAWDISTASYSQSFSVSSQETDPSGIEFTVDGSSFFIVGHINDTVYKYNLSTAWDISTASYNSSFSVSSQDGQPEGIRFSADGTKMYIIGNSTDDVYQYTTGSAYTVTYDSTLQWGGGTAPDSPLANETDVLTFSTRDGGTTYQAAIAIDGAA